MSALDTAWNLLWLAMCWAFYALAVVGAAIILFACVVGLARAARDLRKRQ